MADIKVKPIKKKNTSTKKIVKIIKLKASEKSSTIEDDMIGEDEDSTQIETECLLRSALKLKNACYAQENEQEDNALIDNLQPIDQLMSIEFHNGFSEIKPIIDISEDKEQDYVIIGCCFPNGIVISVGHTKVLLRGINDMPDQEMGDPLNNVGFTKITRLLWKDFLKTHKDWPPLLNGFVYEVGIKRI